MALAFDPIPLNVQIEDPVPTIPPLGKSPITAPSIWQENNIIYIQDVHPDYTLTLLDGSGTVVYAAYVPSSLTTVALPATLTGTYELQLQPVGSDYYFYGYIYL